MRYNITVDVPLDKQLPYTLYARGILAGSPEVEDDNSFVHFKFLGGTVFILFYTFKNERFGCRDYRRAYIATGYQDERDGDAVKLPGIKEKLFILYEARGRKIDNLKRSLFILTEGKKETNDVFTFPLIFWFRLAGTINIAGAPRSDIVRLKGMFKSQEK